jgi:hypothetical protein
MAEHPRRDGHDLEPAPEEAAIESWLEDSDVYLSIPGANRLRLPLRSSFDRRRDAPSAVGPMPS